MIPAFAGSLHARTSIFSNVREHANTDANRIKVKRGSHAERGEEKTISWKFVACFSMHFIFLITLEDKSCC